ncbi:MAG TPA: VWA domain-containing protein [Thermoguttaceae bacterium]|nr:VWA domain-containing protein [Thermoguttaceae bacterium]
MPNEREANEAQWTAYALGQLDGAEREAVERELRENADAAAFVAEIRALGEHVRAARCAEPLPAASTELRQRMVEQTQTPDKEVAMKESCRVQSSERIERRRRRRSFWATAAASFVAGGIVTGLLLPAARPNVSERKVTADLPKDAPRSPRNEETEPPLKKPSRDRKGAVVTQDAQKPLPYGRGSDKPALAAGDTANSRAVIARRGYGQRVRLESPPTIFNYGFQSITDPFGVYGSSGEPPKYIFTYVDPSEFPPKKPYKINYTSGTTAIGDNRYYDQQTPGAGPQPLYGKYYAGGYSTIRGFDFRVNSELDYSGPFQSQLSKINATGGTTGIGYNVAYDQQNVGNAASEKQTMIETTMLNQLSLVPDTLVSSGTYYSGQSLGTPCVEYTASQRFHADTESNATNGQVPDPSIDNAVLWARTHRYSEESIRHQRARQLALLQSLNRVEGGQIALSDDEPICYPPVEVWDYLAERSGRFAFGQGTSVIECSTASAVEAGQAAVNDSGPIGYPATESLNYAGKPIVWGRFPATVSSTDVAMGRDSLRMNVTPRIIISEEEEERIGASPNWYVDQRVRVAHQPRPPVNTEQYAPIVENRFLAPFDSPLSTFSIDIDTASYANVRRFLDNNQLPPPDAVRVEELVNYFTYDYPRPTGDEPFSVNFELTDCPWGAGRQLLRVGLAGRRVESKKRGPSNLVFLLDTSGSMAEPNKMPLVKQAMRLLVDQLGEDDRVAIVTYADTAAVRLESTNGRNKKVILDAIEALQAVGSTNGSGGIQLAYQQAKKNFQAEGNNRVILATDGDLNVGVTDDDELAKLIAEKARSGVFLSVLGFGMGNLKDAKLEKLADRGNGHYAYVDSLREARKVLVEQLTGSLVTIAKDVKIQIEFNPARVAAYRLIGYENRRLAARDFNDDAKDAGEIGSGHTVTALYEIVPAEAVADDAGRGSPELKYQKVLRPDNMLTKAADSDELATVRLRYKEPDGKKSRLIERTVSSKSRSFSAASPDTQFAAAVASFGMILRGSRYAGRATLAAVEEYATPGLGNDPSGYRAEFVDLVHKACQLQTAAARAGSTEKGGLAPRHK